MKKSILAFCFLSVYSIVFAQNNTIPDDSMLHMIASEKDPHVRARIIWDCLGSSEIDPVLDMQIAEKLLVHSKQTHDPIEEVISLACLGYDYRAFGDKTKSLRYDLEADSVAEQNPSEEAKAGALVALAFNYEDMGDYSKAIKLNSASVELGTKTKFDKVVALALVSLGEIYLSMNKIDSALIFSQRGYEIATHINYPDALDPLLGQLGIIQEKLGHPALAVGYFDLAIQEGYNMKSPKFINESYTAKAQYYYDAKQNDSAILYAKKAIEAVKNTAFSNINIYPAKLLLDIYRNTNVDSAFKYSEIYRIANDSLFNAKTIQQTQLIAFEDKVHQQQLADEKAKADEQRKQNIQYVLIALGIVIFIILFLLLSRSIIVNEKWVSFFGVLGLLVVFEFINLVLHPTIASATHDSPVFMLLVLVVIAALLIPMHNRIEKWIKEKMVEKNKKIRLEAAKRTIEKLENKS